MAKVRVETTVKLDGVVIGQAEVSRHGQDPCADLEVIRGEARDQASQAIDNAKDKLGCKRESQEGKEDHDLDRGGPAAPAAPEAPEAPAPEAQSARASRFRRG